MPEFEIRDLRFHLMGPVNLRVEAGTCVGVSGPSGAGKTLLLRALADLDPHTGTVSLGGVPAEEMRGPEWRRRVGYLPAESAWWGAEVGDHMVREDPELLAALGFGTDVFGWRVDRLSSGERQRLALARLLLAAPEALLLDEPTANLDPESAERVERLVEGYRKERDGPVIWVGHDPGQLERVARRRFTMEAGRLAPPEGGV